MSLYKVIFCICVVCLLCGFVCVCVCCLLVCVGVFVFVSPACPALPLPSLACFSACLLVCLVPRALCVCVCVPAACAALSACLCPARPACFAWCVCPQLEVCMSVGMLHMELVNVILIHGQQKH